MYSDHVSIIVTLMKSGLSEDSFTPVENGLIVSHSQIDPIDVILKKDTFAIHNVNVSY